MKTLLSLALIFTAQVSMADGPCKSLSNYVGTYKQVSKTCDDYFHLLGDTLTVIPYTETNYSGYWINASWSGGTIGWGPTTSETANDSDKCTVAGNNVLVQISENDTTGTVLPHKGRISFNFSPSSTSFTADGCTGNYVKQ